MMKGLLFELQGIKIVDIDIYIVEYFDFFVKNVLVRLKDKVLYVVRVNGVDCWKCGEMDFGLFGGNVICVDYNKFIGCLLFLVFEQGYLGVWDVKEWLCVMDDMGIYVQICFQNLGVIQVGLFMLFGDNEFVVMILKFYNDVLIEWQVEFGECFFMMVYLLIWDKVVMEVEVC